MKREKILKTILIILIIIILAFFVNLGRKTAILISIENKREKINEIDNIYYKSEKLSDNTKVIQEMFRKGDIVKRIESIGENNGEEIKAEIIIINTSEEERAYVTSEEGYKGLFIEKTSRNYKNEYVEKHTFIENAKYAMNSKITTKNYNGEKCYVIEGKYTPYSNGYQDIINTIAYVNKDTGIKVKSLISANVISRNSNRRSRV